MSASCGLISSVCVFAHWIFYSFGASEKDGYGINCELLWWCVGCGYVCSLFFVDLAGPEIIKFGVECKHSSPLTSTQAFKVAIQTVLLDMKAICSSQTLKAHL